MATVNTGRRVIVAGGSGFIGRHIVQALVEAGDLVCVLARHADEHHRGSTVEYRSIDLGIAPPPQPWLDHCDAVINVVGIKAPRGGNSFDRAHIHVVEHLITAARTAGVERIIHISVALADHASDAYASTKRAGEQRVQTSGLAFTIIRPGLVYGPGDEALSNLIQMVRLSPVVPVPSGATGPLPVIDVDDLAAAVVATLGDPQSIGTSFDLVGPETLELRTMVHRVAHALALPTWTPAIPDRLARFAAHAMERAFFDPPLSRSQLQMLTHGLPGRAETLVDRRGLAARPLKPPRIRQIASHVPTRWPSVRLVTSVEHRRWLMETAADLRRWPLALGAGLLMLLGLPTIMPSIWNRMALINGLLLVAFGASMHRTWRALLRPTIRRVVVGLGLAAGLYAGAAAFMTSLRVIAPSFALQAQEIYQWSQLAPVGQRLALLGLIVVGEDLVWRATIALPLAARFGPVRGCVLAGAAFALAHLTTGPPLLWVAAWAMGTLWSAIGLRSQSLVPVIVSHLAWDIAVMFVRPL